jgi:SHS2 domain-containing protein
VKDGLARWVEVRTQAAAPSASREALVRCALDLLAARGATLLRATPIELAGEGTDEHGRCVIEIGGDALDSALAAVSAALEERVALTPAGAREDARGVGEALAGFPTEAIDHTADEAFAVEARDRADLLAAAAEALGALIVRPAGVRAERSIGVDARAPEPDWPDDDRLFAWLAEVLYVLDKERFALRRAVVLEDGDGGVRGALFGEPIDEARHEVGGGIKAVTYHGMEITPMPGGGLRAQVVIDV